MSRDRSHQEQVARLQNRWVDAGSFGIFTRVRETAGAPPLVLIHGLGVSSRYMIPTARQLVNDFTVYVPDLPGFGRSAKPPATLNIPQLADALAIWMQSVGLDRAAFLGNSFGCQITAELMVRCPECVSKAVLQGPTVDPQARTSERQIARWLLDGTREPPSLGCILVSDFLAAGTRRLWETFRFMLRDHIEEKLPRIEIPTLVVRGARDPIVPQRWARRAAQLLPNGRLRVVRGAPHTMNYAAPGKLARLARSFLQNSS